MDANQFLYLEKILKSQHANLNDLKNRLDNGEMLTLSRRLELLAFAGRADGAIMALMATMPQPLVDKYAYLKDISVVLAEYALTLALEGVEDLEEMCNDEGDEREEEKSRFKPDTDMSVTDPFGRPVPPAMAGIRRRRRRR